MKQLLMDIKAGRLCHKDDPPTSRKAAEKTVEGLSQKRKYVLNLIKEYCEQDHKDFTAKEVAGGINAKYFDIQRRKNELAALGYIAKTGEERGGCEVWELV